MYSIKNFEENDDIRVLGNLGAFTVIQYERDLSVTPVTAQNAFFSAQMNVKRRQLVCDLSKGAVTVQSGAMQWMVGNVTGESAIKPEYTGTGKLVLEPTYKYLLLMNTEEWGGSVVLEDGLFLACESTLKQKAVMRSNISSAVAGGEGLFNLSLNGTGAFCIESNCPREELIEIVLDNDVVKIDGNMAIAWSGSLEFSVERSGKTLIGSAASGEGLVNVYRGTGKVLLAPVAR